MAYRSKLKQRLYQIRWRRAHPNYQKEYWKKYRELSGLRKRQLPDAPCPTPSRTA